MFFADGLMSAEQSSQNQILPLHGILGEYSQRRDQQPSFVRHLFDARGATYDDLASIVGLGSGFWYRRRALRRAGLKPGMRVTAAMKKLREKLKADGVL
jgi:demethylmenaquinone methyltransferase/2-methoxy-6-polyprenyl-1,4-benzoquinol methylase